MWCRIDARLWHVCYLFIISPLCGVAQTPDCGTFVIYFTYEPFLWCRSDARLRHSILLSYCISHVLREILVYVHHGLYFWD